mmetsp:Transcript_14055/g.20776  ORF Transcript_14055/g.20776 Transcript_14055/m.20776 type:complete len:645 (+) Transcript_14055:66-2000(+)
MKKASIIFLSFVLLLTHKAQCFLHSFLSSRKNNFLRANGLINEFESSSQYMFQKNEVIVPLIIPFTERGKIDYISLGFHLNFLKDSGIECILCNSSMGKGEYLTKYEQKSVLSFCRNNFPFKIYNNISTICLNDAIELTKFSSFADGIVLSLSFPSEVCKKEIKSFVKKITESAQVPISIEISKVEKSFKSENSLIKNFLKEFKYLISFSKEQTSEVFAFNSEKFKSIKTNVSIDLLSNVFPKFFSDQEKINNFDSKRKSLEEHILNKIGVVNTSILKLMVSKMISGYQSIPRLPEPALEPKQINSVEKLMKNEKSDVEEVLVNKVFFQLLNDFHLSWLGFEKLILESIQRKLKSLDEVIGRYISNEKFLNFDKNIWEYMISNNFLATTKIEKKPEKIRTLTLSPEIFFEKDNHGIVLSKGTNIVHLVNRNEKISNITPFSISEAVQNSSDERDENIRIFSMIIDEISKEVNQKKANLEVDIMEEEETKYTCSPAVLSTPQKKSSILSLIEVNGGIFPNEVLRRKNDRIGRKNSNFVSIYKENNYLDSIKEKRYGTALKDNSSKFKSKGNESIASKKKISKNKVISKGNDPVKSYAVKELEQFFSSKGIESDADTFDWNKLRQGPSYLKSIKQDGQSHPKYFKR